MLARFGPTAWSPSIATWLASHCRRLAAAARIASFRLRGGLHDGRAAHHDRARRIGAVALLHDRSVEPCCTRLMRSIGISSASAAICANTVSTPCPTADEPT